MARKTLIEKLSILADAAKYDASCASSGSEKRHALRSGGLGSTEGMGICHAYAPDGRCISLLKVLLTNFCVFDCRYCVNRVSSNVERARFTPEELVDLTISFYKRNYIEGLFLSSGIIRDSDYTMEQMILVAKTLRTTHGFQGYIHLKTIPDASAELITEAGRWADRLSINVELPTDQSLTTFAPEKSAASIRRTMTHVRDGIDEARDDAKPVAGRRRPSPRRFSPAGQTSQMIVGADDASDATIIGAAARLYTGHRLKRVYYSAFSPIPDASRDLPPIAPPLLREHRLYQADWMFRFYGFDVDEILAGSQHGMLDLDIDPKLAWALAHREVFPVDLNTAPREMLLRVPGIGTKSAERLIRARRTGRLTLADLTKITRSSKKLLPFVTARDWSPGSLTDCSHLRDRFVPPPAQLSLF